MNIIRERVYKYKQISSKVQPTLQEPKFQVLPSFGLFRLKKPPSIVDMSLEQTIGNLEIRYANVVTFVGSSNTMVDTTTGRIQTKGIQHNSNVITDVSGPHGRVAPTLKKYPEIAFESGKFDSNDSTNTYVQAGYTVTDSSHHNEYYGAWIFDDQTGFVTNKNLWISPINTYTTSGGAGTPTMTTSDARCTTVSGVATPGEWVQLKLPNKVKLSSISIMGPTGNGGTGSQDLGRAPKDAVLAGSVDGTTWNSVLTWSGVQPYVLKTYKSFPANVDSTNYYNYFRLIVTKNDGTHVYASIQELQLYGYEEDPPAGDHSVDTTFKSRFNNPQLTGVQVLVDGATGVGTNHISGGPDPSGNQATYVTDGKYWTLNGTLTSNLSVEANTFLEGDQPHAVSVWFNSSNLEANVSNTCVFSIASEEKLDSVNLDLQSNTWHNLTYAYQGEGGSKVTYLDGRKVAEDQAEDTFGEYPPFEMTGYSQGGYAASASSEYLSDVNALRNAYKVYNPTTDTAGVWMTEFSTFNPNAVGGDTFTDSDGGTHTGHWNKIELPYKLKPSYFYFKNSGTLTGSRNATNWVILGSNNDSEWDLLHSSTTVLNATKSIPITATKGYTYLMFLCKSVNADTALYMEEIRYYGHRENDLVRLPDPTNVLKYPHVALTGPAQRGYVASASSNYSTSSNPAWYGFTEDDANKWASLSSTYDTGNPFVQSSNRNLGTMNGGSGTVNGEWLMIEIPHKLKLQSTTIISPDNGNEVPDKFIIYGTNDLTGAWSIVDNTYQTTEANIGTGASGKTWTVSTASGSNSYRYFGFVTTNTNGGGGLVAIDNWELYGTGVDSVPIQIGGGNIDKVANFRVYDKFIGEDQALEIWDAQKEEFGRAKPQMVLQQGKLGIGTDAPQGSLSVADEPDPTYGLQEFPPKPLAGYKTHIEGHGEFCASASSIQSSSRVGWVAFNKSHMSPSTSVGWISGYNPIAYNSSGVATGNIGVLNGVNGEYLILESPYKIKMDHVLIYPRAHVSTTESYSLPPKDGKIWGRNVIDEPWTEITSYTNLTYGATRADNLYGQIPTRVNINATQYYKYIAFQITATNVSYQHTYTDYTNIKELRYFGYREQLPPKQSILHDGQLTLTKNLTVPRIGPALDADDTPRRDRLVVEYNTSTNPTFDGAVRDTGGRGFDGIFKGTATYDSYQKDLTFPANSDRIETGSSLDGIKLQTTNTVSVWVKCNNPTSWEAICIIGEDTSRKHLGLWVRDATSVAVHSDNALSGGGGNFEYEVGDMEKWNHITVVRYGTSFEDHHVYVNGAKVSAGVSTGKTDGGFDLNKKTHLTLGTSARGLYGSATAQNYHLDGSLSNFKLYDMALTAEEVKKLYDMGRCDEGGHVVNFSKTRVGIGLGDGEAPRSALDVRDLIYAESSSVQTFTGQHICFPDESMEKGLVVSAKKNQFVKLNGLAIGKSAITIDESLPIVSLSNVAQDKACFGVVSKMEETNAAYRTEITGGLVSESIKIAGDNRAVVNSVGEGAIWVVDTNGPLESGDYITTSNVAGYGQKQDDDVLHNFTVAKITMDCDFTASNVAVQTIKREQTGTQIITEDAWNQLVEYDRYSNVEDEITTYYHIQRGGNVLDENGQLQFEDKTGATEEPYERRFLTTDGTQTDEANAAHIAAFVGCTYHCG